MGKKWIVATALCVFSSLALPAATVAHKGIVPVIGSTATSRDAMGFETSIRIVGKEGLRGRLVFHPAGQVANDDTDPSAPYACLAAGCGIGFGSLRFVGGPPFIGSLDIIPDPDSDQTIPSAFTRIVFWADSFPLSIKPLGTPVPRIISDEWFHQQQDGAARSSIFIANLGPSVRAKLGFRTLTAITYSVTVIHNGVAESTPSVSGATLPADYTMLLPIEQVVGRSLGQFDDVRVDIESGSAIGFYSYTHNVTNEPDVEVPPAVDEALVPTLVP